MIAWIILILAGLFEVGWTIGMKYADGFTKPIPSLLTLLAIVLSMYLLAVAVRTLPLGTAYAVWTGIGIVGTSLLSIFLFGESSDPWRLVFIGLIMVGIVGLQWMTSTH